MLTIQNQHLRLGFDDVTGGLAGFHVLETGWHVLDRESRNALSFQALVPAEDRRNNAVSGQRQVASRISADGDGLGISIEWSGLQSSHRGRLDIELRERVRLDGPVASFELSIHNRSNLTVGAVQFPCFVGLEAASDDETLTLFRSIYGSARDWGLRPRFESNRPYFGTTFPTQYHVGNPALPFILLRSADQGLMVAVAGATAELVAWTAELCPGYSDSLDDRVPDVSSISGSSVEVRFAATHAPFILPGESRSLTPIVVNAYRGGWQEGVEAFRGLSHRSGSRRPLPEWVDRPHSWWQIQMNSPEDDLRCTFADLVEMGTECADCGVSCIQLVGWNAGGQDGRLPYHDPDPRLGSAAELKDAMVQTRRLGVRTILFCKFTWAERNDRGPWRELMPLAVKDPHGEPYLHPGYQYSTPLRMLDVGTRRLVPLCFLADEVRELCAGEFAKVLDLEPDGVLIDECFHHGPAWLCFDAGHGHRVGAPVHAGDELLMSRLRRLAADRNCELILGGEWCYPAQSPDYDISYMRTWGRTHLPVERVLHDGLLMTAVTGFDDRNMVNQCLLYRYVVSYEPFHFKGRLRDFPLTVEYGRRMDALRTALRAHLWDGRFQGEQGATVTTGRGTRPSYSVHMAKDGSVCVAVANYDPSEVEVRVELETGRTPAAWKLVEDSEWREFAGSAVIPGRSAAVVMEGVR